jgi:hypothetical protein
MAEMIKNSSHFLKRCPEAMPPLPLVSWSQRGYTGDIRGQHLAKSGILGEDPQAMTAAAVKDPSLIPVLLDGLSVKNSSKYRRAKALTLISESHPAVLYPYFDFFAGLLEKPVNILKWNAVFILSNLVAVDTERRFDRLFERFYYHLWDGNLITTANILGVSGKIARARPDLHKRLTTEILKVEIIPLPTDECRQIARGKALLAFKEYADSLKGNRQVIDFARRCQQSRRPATRKKAEALAVKIGV